jgi:membrane protease YdiL (CAAX protease family)
MRATAAWDVWSRLVAAPAEPAVDADERTVEILGLELPFRASVAIVLATLVLLIDFSRVAMPAAALELGRTPDGLRAIALERVVLFGLVPLAVIVALFRDRPSRYGLRIGDWRAGLPLVLAGCVLMTPIVLWFAGQPDVRAYYAPSAGPVPEVVLTNTLDLTAAEFLYRGFLMFTLVRTIGPLGILIAVMPFAFAHLGKPVLELLSTLVGGLAYGWLAWRTRSILWGSIAHVYILSLVTVAAGAGSPPPAP